MRLHRPARYNPALFVAVPAVNVLFLVVLFFALSSTFLFQPGIAIALPTSSFALGPQRDALMISLTSSPAPAIYFQDRRVTLEEVRSELAGLADSGRTLVIRADRHVPYDTVMRITNAGLERGISVVLATTQAEK